MANQTNDVWRVTYHFEVGGKKVSDELQDNVLCVGQAYNTIAAVLSGNGRTNNAHGFLVITGIQHVSGASGVLS